MSHHRIATVATADLDAAVAAVHATDADLVEVRLDAFWPTPPGDEAVDVLLRLTATEAPLLATLRPKRQGGAFDGPEEVRLSLLAAAVRAGFQAVDLEDDHPEVGRVVRWLRDEGAEVLLSDHRNPDVPAREAAMKVLLSMQDLDGLVQKVAFPVGSFMGVLRALELACQHRSRNGRPAIAPLGASAMVRALLPLAGNQATYGHAAGSGPAVQGQPALADMDAVWAHWGLAPDELGRSAEWFAVLGDPVVHSLSPRIHNAALRGHGDARRYGALQVPDSIASMRLVATVGARIGLRGASVTAPLKGHAAAVAACDDAATAIGAANCLRFDGLAVHATNTDATALVRLLKGASRVGVLGAGGAARAAVWAAGQVGAEPVFTSRDAARADALRADLGADWVPWGDRHTIACDAWVQATPVGDATLLDGLGEADRLVELAYAGGPTPLQDLATEQGLRVTDGRAFLVEQGLDAFRFWTGQEADRGLMEAALP